MPWDVFIFYIGRRGLHPCRARDGGRAEPGALRDLPGDLLLQVAGVFVMLGAEFLAVDPDHRLHRRDPGAAALRAHARRSRRSAGVPSSGAAQRAVIGGLLGLMLLLEVGDRHRTARSPGAQGNATPENVARSAATRRRSAACSIPQYLLPFEIVSMVLTVGVLGAIVLALPERLGLDIGRRRDTISLAHPRGTDSRFRSDDGCRRHRCRTSRQCRAGRSGPDADHGQRPRRPAGERLEDDGS